jgi:hypothetical protein
VTTPSEVLLIAANQIGIAENPPKSNATPFSDWYGFHDAWCAMFQSWCFDQAGLPLGPGPKGAAWCSAMADWFDLQGRLVYGTGGLRAGDVIFFEWGTTAGGYDHVGIVERVHGDGFITTIEGNMGDRVQRLVRWLATAGIDSYGRPAYTASRRVASRLEDVLMAEISETRLRQIIREETASPTEVMAIVVKQLGGVNARLNALKPLLEKVAEDVVDIEQEAKGVGGPGTGRQLREDVREALEEIKQLEAALDAAGVI